ncbi:MAG TPA: tRNA (5-methylaminomethyl-2-thiouridine)(34)-methyltransferase MnmD [Chitinophagaceae bacterium]|nr:tRNA (5-methylaminomethyl-2-thiouridine)(34)-methyltransferase MnmD [Chitinophagaceae bacterium]
MDRKIILTGDGSHSISVPELNVPYHSIYGAVQESMHVFINAGFYQAIKSTPARQIKILEVGFGTGLNALLTLVEAEKIKTKVYYEAIELYPLNNEEIRTLNYCRHLNRPELQPIFEELHSCKWEKEIPITKYLALLKRNDNLLNLAGRRTGPEFPEPMKLFELIYFDAFAPNAQPELWTKEVFDRMYAMLEPGGILVTYCSKGDVRRAMIAAGFEVEKLPGPPRKREMLRAAHPIVI